MSFENILLIIFVVLPLLDLLRSAVQKRQSRGSEEVPARPRPVRQQPRNQTSFPPPPPEKATPAEAPAAQDAPAVTDVADVAAARRYIADERIARRKRGERRAAVTETALQPAPEQDRHDEREVVWRLRSPGGVRSALVAITVLGPCRAIEPYDWREDGR